jgi:hypothetical protein
MNFRWHFFQILIKNGSPKTLMLPPFSLLFRSHLYLLPT